MNLNNKGFAISTVMYMILVMAALLIILTLTLLGNRKLILDKIKDETKDFIYGRLPSEYQEVEYIESTGTQRIDTNIAGEYDLNLDCKFNVNNNKRSLMGASTKAGAYFGITADGYYELGDTSVSNFSGSERNKIRVIRDSNQISLEVKGETITRAGVLAPENFMLFNFIVGGYSCSVKIYSATFMQNGILVRNFIPCYRKSDNEIGMYDTVNNVFYTNQGTGTFVKGNDV